MTSPHVTFKRRLERATLSLNAYPADESSDTESVMTDLLTDLRHYCEFHGLEYDQFDGIAANHFNAESTMALSKDT